MHIAPGIGFLMPPKTGSSWIVFIMKKILEVDLINPFSNRHMVPDETDLQWLEVPKGIRYVMLIREEESWLRSIYKTWSTNFHIPVLDSLCEGEKGSEEDFIKEHIGNLDPVWNYYLKKSPEYMLHTETIADDLIHVLLDTGYTLSDHIRQKIRTEPHKNVTQV